MAATVKFESAQFVQQLQRLRKGVKGDLDEFIIGQAGTWISDVIKYSWPKQRMHGVKAVRRDLPKAVKPLSHKGGKAVPATFDGLTDERLRNRLNMLLRAKNYEAIEAITKTWKGEWGRKDIERFRPELHKRARNKRGHVPKRSWVATPDVDDWKKYKDLLESRVGLYKHGWVGAARAVERMGAKGVKVPKWVSKTRDKPTGTGFKSGTGNKMVITMRNPYGYAHGADATVRFVSGLRAKKMGNSINRILKGKAHQYGFKVR